MARAPVEGVMVGAGDGVAVAVGVGVTVWVRVGSARIVAVQVGSGVGGSTAGSDVGGSLAGADGEGSMAGSGVTGSTAGSACSRIPSETSAGGGLPWQRVSISRDTTKIAGRVMRTVRSFLQVPICLIVVWAAFLPANRYTFRARSADSGLQPALLGIAADE